MFSPSVGFTALNNAMLSNNRQFHGVRELDGKLKSKVAEWPFTGFLLNRLSSNLYSATKNYFQWRTNGQFDAYIGVAHVALSFRM